ncbi:PilZ domain-containing protein [Sulfuriflexus mobilis]|uniref:PilZ domain-containing protein n=1 Tax=Sulfuriflexus mobilis TaxID=1811807 RepID=UPI00155954A3|nr:PilZ domain-containing protein [Sulfuriflexus mobilis]
MSEGHPEPAHNKRVFPRMVATCPVLYRTHEEERWCVGMLLDFSATGVLMTCNRDLPIGTLISLRLERGRHRDLPALSGSGNIVRCDKLSIVKYEVACKLTHIDPPDKAGS